MASARGITRSDQSFIHAIAVDQYTDDSPAVGPELITVQCADTQFRPRTPVPTPDFAPAIKVAETPLSQQELPVAVVSAASPDSPVEKSPAPTKTTTYLDPQESEVAKEFDAKYNVANQTELHTIVLGLIAYDLKTRKLFKGGTTPFHFDDFSACRGEIANFVAYMTPYLKTLPHQPQRIAVYGGQMPGTQFVGRDPQWAD